MITASEIKKKAEKRYIAHLSSVVRGEAFEKWVIACDKKPSEDLQAYQKEHDDIFAASKDVKGYGYQIEWQTVHKKSIGVQDIPALIYFESETDLLRFLRKETEVNQFRKDVARVLHLFPELKEWMAQFPLKVIKYTSEWTDLLKVLTYFKEHPYPHLYVRELPIEVHTKFIGAHEGILKELLDIVIAPHVDTNETKFCRRFHLRDKEPMIRMRWLDDRLSRKYFSGMEEATVPLSQLEQFHPTVQRVFVVENEINFLTFPKISDSILLWGHGFEVSLLKHIPFLQQTELFYWGDLDVHGFEILSQFRGYFPQAQSILMDAHTFHTYYEGNEGKTSNVKSLLHLDEEELALYQSIKEHNWRLEQEKIPHRYAVEQIEKTVKKSEINRWSKQ